MASVWTILKWAGGLGLVGVSAVSMVRATRTSPDVDALRAELSRLKRAPQRAPQLIVHEVPVASPSQHEAIPTEQAPARTNEDDKLSDEEREYRLNVFNDAREEVCEKRFAEEADDPEWSRQAEAAIRTEFSGEHFESVQLSIDCRSTLCRMDFVYPKESLLSPEVRHRLVATQPWAGQRFTRLDTIRGDGFSYFSRPGFDLPNVDPSTLNY